MRARFDFLADGRPVLFESPSRILIARTTAEVGPVMAAAGQALRDGSHVAGWVTYEAAPAFDAALVTQAPTALPIVYFGIYREKREAPPLEPAGASLTAPIWTPQLSRAVHRDGVAAIREAIADGDTYQINYTFRLSATVPSVRSPGASAPGYDPAVEQVDVSSGVRDVARVVTGQAHRRP